MSSTADIPDVRGLRNESLPSAGFPAGGRQDFRVFFRPAVHEQIWKHAAADSTIEICGVLVGLWQRDDAGPYALISEYVRCDSAKSGFAEVTFTHEAWTKINGEMDTRFADLKIVGWYHSHPNFGIFLSDRDIFIHQHFFSGPGQIAHVVDPVRKFDGVFAWQDGKPALLPHFWVGERVYVTPDKPVEESAPETRGLHAAAEGSSATSAVSSPLIGSVTTVLLMACTFLIGFLLSGRLTDWERRLERQRDLVGVVAYFAEHKLVRPGLEEDLQKFDADLRSLAADADTLAREQANLAGSDAAKQKEPWERLRQGLADAGQKLDRIRRKDLLTPEEESIVKEVMRALLELDRKGDHASERLSRSAPARAPEGERGTHQQPADEDQPDKSRGSNNAQGKRPRPDEDVKLKKD